MDMGKNKHPPEALSEDSMDIYDGLDVEPHGNTGKSPTDASQLKESMDLYEELVTEEQQNRESTYSELMSRFQAAQNQIKELHKRLQQMEVQNTGLNTENYRLKKNISALLQTARQEVTRKDAEIQRLNQRPDRGCCHHHHNLGDKGQPQRSSSDGSKNRLLPSTTQLPPPHQPHNPPPALTPPPTSLPKKDQPIRQPSQSSRKESTSHTSTHSGASKTSSYHHSKSSSKGSSSTHHSESHKPKTSHREEKHHTQSESSDREHRSSDPSKDCHGSEKNSCKSERGTARSNPTSSKPRSLDNEEHHRSHRMKSPLHHSKAVPSSTEKKRREDPVKFPPTEGERHRSSKDSCSRADRKSKCHEKTRSSDIKDDKRLCSQQHGVGRSECSKERSAERASKSEPRKEDRVHAAKLNRESKSSSSSERSRNCVKQSSKDLSHRDACRKEGQARASRVFKHKATLTGKSCVEESSPNRKLCFMETLNLTRSPIKKAALSTEGNHASVDAAEEPTVDQSSQPDIENMHVIDEVNTSELEDEPQGTKDLPPESCADEPGLQGGDQKGSEPVSPDKAPEGHLAHVRPLTDEESQKSVCLTHTSPDSSSFQAAKGHGEDDPEPVQPAADGAECSSSPTNLSGNLFHKTPDATDPAVTGSSEKQVCSPTTALQRKQAEQSASQLKGSPAISSVPDTAYLQSSQTFLPQDRLEPSPAAPCSNQEKDSDVVSSTISLDSLPQEGLSLPDAIYMLTQTGEPAGDVDSTTNKMGALLGCDAASKISSTTQDVVVPDNLREPTVTPKKSFSPAKSQQNEWEPPSSKPLVHDEDSMMRILSNLRRIPDAISPLRSPVQTSKRSHLCAQSRPGLVKSLEKEFSSTAVDGSTKKLDVNKENKYPGSPGKHEAQTLEKGSSLPPQPSDTELEEGEILSESEETAADSPAPAPKRAKVERPVKNKGSPRTGWSKTSVERCAASKDANVTDALMSHSPKSRFKTVCPAATKTSFSSVEEVMETFKLVRAEIRKKYMKLHKTFPRKSFYGVMDNFQESFLEFVDGAYLGRICTQPLELRQKLKKLVASVFSKVSNNGIVKRIFEQQAVDLKQKLWDFVDVQVDYLFRDIHSTLKSFCPKAEAEAAESRPGKREAGATDSPSSAPRHQLKEARPPSDPHPAKAVVPYRTGLGSRGKDIRILHVDKDRKAEGQPKGGSTPPLATLLPATPEKRNSLLLPQNGSLFDKTDFELLTEQQASSLTFNLVRDTQMGEIFKCLLQGTDLLDASSIPPDSAPWALGTPRKDGERMLGITTPSKFDSPAKFSSKLNTPSKLIAAWSSISPHRLASPRARAQIPLNPALFDESCLLEVPLESRAQRSYSLLAEDLAVSLTIPSPLKSDSHLSFLHPASTHAMSTPDSVISAHISEDALLDGEDATEQDIHLALDTDNSSCGSSSSKLSEVLATPFVFKPDQPMQALVMEKSNDHFIVKIRQANLAPDAVPGSDQTAGEPERPRQEARAGPVLEKARPSDVLPEEQKPTTTDSSLAEGCSSTTDLADREEERGSRRSPAVRPTRSEAGRKLPGPQGPDAEGQPSEPGSSQHRSSTSPGSGPSKRCHKEVLQSSSDTGSTHSSPQGPTGARKKTPEPPADTQTGKGRPAPATKRKVHQERSGRKRHKKQQPEEEEAQDDDDGSKSSPSSLSAKNVVKKKGAVVMSWTRDEDRAILMELKAQGASRGTFSALSEKLKKPSGQIAQRFYQLMKLYKKQGKVVM